MIAKANEMITSTICNEIEDLIKAQINLRLRQMPRTISVSQIFKFLTPASTSKKIDPLFFIDENVIIFKLTNQICILILLIII